MLCAHLPAHAILASYMQTFVQDDGRTFVLLFLQAILRTNGSQRILQSAHAQAFFRDWRDPHRPMAFDGTWETRRSLLEGVHIGSTRQGFLLQYAAEEWHAQEMSRPWSTYSWNDISLLQDASTSGLMGCALLTASVVCLHSRLLVLIYMSYHIRWWQSWFTLGPHLHMVIAVVFHGTLVTITGMPQKMGYAISGRSGLLREECLRHLCYQTLILSGACLVTRDGAPTRWRI